MEQKKNKKFSLKKLLLRSLAVIVFLLLVGVAIIDLSIRRASIPVCQAQTTSMTIDTLANADIKCPFLKIARPASTGIRAFARDCEMHGMNYGMAMYVGIQITWQQKGLWSVLRGETPDIYQLNKTRGVSHCDLFARYYNELKEKAEEVQVEGQITLQDLVKIKKWIAEQEGVTVIEPSKIETALIFVRAGGDFETQKVYTEDVLLLVSGQDPKRDGLVSPTTLSRARKMAIWE